jgi:hypothetical protein
MELPGVPLNTSIKLALQKPIQNYYNHNNELNTIPAEEKEGETLHRNRTS